MNATNLADLLGPIEEKDPRAAPSPKIILWGRDDVLAHAMESLLAARGSWEIVRIYAEQGEDYLLEQARRIQPSMIILYAGDCAGGKDLPIRLIQNQPELRVATVSIENNLIQICEKYSRVIRESSDLLAIIEDKYLLDLSLQKEVNQGKVDD
jgi:hypothetical protein